MNQQLFKYKYNVQQCLKQNSRGIAITSFIYIDIIVVILSQNKGKWLKPVDHIMKGNDYKIARSSQVSVIFFIDWRGRGLFCNCFFLPLLWCQGFLHWQSMDTLHLFFKCHVHKSMPFEKAFPFKRWWDYLHVKACTTSEQNPCEIIKYP